MSLARSSDATLDRHLRLAGTRNLRDVGGYPASGGRRTRWRTLLRTDALDRLPVASQRELIDLGIRQVIDLRWPKEAESSPSVFRESSDVVYANLPLFDEAPPPGGTPVDVYRLMLDSRSAQFAAVAGMMIEPNGLPAIVGCTAGVDRTGMTVALILSAVGVPVEVVAADYAISAESFAGDGKASGLDDWRVGPVAVDCKAPYMEEALEHLERAHGGAAALLERHGFTGADVERLRELLTEPVSAPS